MNTIRPNASLQYTQACLNQLQHRLRHKLKGWIPTPLLIELRKAISVFHSTNEQVLFLQKDNFTREKMEFVGNTGDALEIHVEWLTGVENIFERAIYDARRIHSPEELPWSLSPFAHLCNYSAALYLHDYGSYHELRMIFPIERSRQIWTTVPPGADFIVENALGMIFVRAVNGTLSDKIRKFSSTFGSSYQTPELSGLIEAARKADADLLALYGGTARPEIPEVSPDPEATLDGIVAAHTAHRDGGLCCEVSSDLPSLELNLLSKDN